MSKPIRALLLAAGLGTRLRPLTLTTPKCLVPIGNQPLLERWLTNLESCGCTDALVNTHHLAPKVKAFLKKRPKSRMNIESTFEPTLLGTAGTLLANQNFFHSSTGLLIHADNATDFDLNDLIQTHHQRPEGCLLTMLTFNSINPERCGIVEINQHGVVHAFHEKVKIPPGTRANGAVYAFDSELIKTLSSSEMPPSDFSTQVLPQIVGKIATHHTTTHFIDIGTPDSLRRAQTIWNQTK